MFLVILVEFLHEMTINCKFENTLLDSQEDVSQRELEQELPDVE